MKVLAAREHWTVSVKSHSAPACHKGTYPKKLFLFKNLISKYTPSLLEPLGAEQKTAAEETVLQNALRLDRVEVELKQKEKDLKSATKKQGLYEQILPLPIVDKLNNEQTIKSEFVKEGWILNASVHPNLLELINYDAEAVTEIIQLVQEIFEYTIHTKNSQVMGLMRIFSNGDTFIAAASQQYLSDPLKVLCNFALQFLHESCFSRLPDLITREHDYIDNLIVRVSISYGSFCYCLHGTTAIEYSVVGPTVSECKELQLSTPENCISLSDGAYRLVKEKNGGQLYQTESRDVNGKKMHLLRNSYKLEFSAMLKQISKKY